MEGEAEESQRLGRVVEHGVEPWLVFRLLGEGPGRTLVDVLIADLDKAPDGFQRPVELQTPEMRLDCRQDLDGCPLQLLVQIGLHRLLRFRHDASGEPLDHGQAAVQEVAEIVRQIRIDPADQGLSGKISILPERHLTQQEVAERIHAEFVHDGVRVYHISRLLDIFSPFAVHQPWAKMVFGSGISRAMSIVDQYTACVVRMSLPTRWMVAGQYRSKDGDRRRYSSAEM